MEYVSCKSALLALPKCEPCEPYGIDANPFAMLIKSFIMHKKHFSALYSHTVIKKVRFKAGQVQLTSHEMPYVNSTVRVCCDVI
jgi:hypothetical protein